MVGYFILNVISCSSVLSAGSYAQRYVYLHIFIKKKFALMVGFALMVVSDVNLKPKIWYTKKIPIPNRYLVFLSQISWYFLGILSEF